MSRGERRLVAGMLSALLAAMLLHACAPASRSRCLLEYRGCEVVPVNTFRVDIDDEIDKQLEAHE